MTKKTDTADIQTVLPTRDTVAIDIGNALLDMGKVELKAAGIETAVCVSEFPTVTIVELVTYGARRWFQDNLNSQAHAAKKAGDAFDAQAAFDARFDQAVTGDIHNRRAAVARNPLDRFMLDILRETLSGATDSASKLIGKGLDACTTTQERRDYAMHVLGGNDQALAIAQARLDATKLDLGFTLADVAPTDADAS